MLTLSGWTVLVLKKLRFRWSSGPKSTSCPEVGNAEGYYTRLLWTIPEEEDTSHTEKHLVNLRIWKSPAIKAFSAGGGGVGGEYCDCNLLTKCMQLKSHFTASLRKMPKSTCTEKACNNPTREESNANTGSKLSSKAIALGPHRSKADEDELRRQCNEIYELYMSIAEGRLPLEKILNVRL